MKLKHPIQVRPNSSSTKAKDFYSDQILWTVGNILMMRSMDPHQASTQAFPHNVRGSVEDTLFQYLMKGAHDFTLSVWAWNKALGFYVPVTIVEPHMPRYKPFHELSDAQLAKVAL